jgi:hypothetical protein
LAKRSQFLTVFSIYNFFNSLSIHCDSLIHTRQGVHLIWWSPRWLLGIDRIGRQGVHVIFVECAMMARIDRLHPAVKHGAYSAIDVLPGESRAAFEKLHRGLIAEYAPSGVHEKHIVMSMARLIWRQKNLRTQRISELGRSLWSELPAIGEKIVTYKNRLSHFSQKDKEIIEENTRAAGQILEKLGDAFELVEIGDAATFDGLTKELEIQERLDAAITRCQKQLMLVRGVKSLAAAPPSAAKPH